MTAKTAYSTKEKLADNLKELTTQLGASSPTLVLFFASTKYSVEKVGAGLQKAYPDAKVVGASTAGKIVTGKMLKNSVVAMAFDKESVADVDVAVVSNIKTEDNFKAAFTQSQRAALTKIVEDRRAIAVELRKALNSSIVNETRVNLLELNYGKCDGEISYYYATAFSQVAKTLNATQMTKLFQIRNLDAYQTQPGTIYLYSQKINQPQIQNTDFLFTAIAIQSPSPTLSPLNPVTTIIPSPSANYPNQVATPTPSNASNDPQSTTTPTVQPTIPEFQTTTLLLLLLAIASLLLVFKNRIIKRERCVADDNSP